MLPMWGDRATVTDLLSLPLPPVERVCAYPEQIFEVKSCHATVYMDQKMEATMPVLLWLLGVPLVVVVALLLTHVI
jgi:hypothetical protein